MQSIMKKNNIIFALVLSFAIFFSCNNATHQNANKKYVAVVDSNYCDSINMWKFEHNSSINFSTKKPKSIQEAIVFFEQNADNNFRNIVVNAPPGLLHFNLGLTIRNRWMNRGNDELQNQLFVKLKLKNKDNGSSVIIGIYRFYLLDSLEVLGKIHIPDSINNYTIVHSELLKIQKDLIELKKQSN